jgi:hypothetical protein
MILHESKDVRSPVGGQQSCRDMFCTIRVVDVQCHEAIGDRSPDGWQDGFGAIGDDASKSSSAKSDRCALSAESWRQVVAQIVDPGLADTTGRRKVRDRDRPS